MEKQAEIFPSLLEPSFKGVTREAVDVLNKRLETVGVDPVKDLSDLKERTSSGLFRKSLKDIGKKSQYPILTGENLKNFLSESGVRKVSNLSRTSVPYSLPLVSEQAVERTDELAVKEQVKTKTTISDQQSFPTTACGEGFDPERCVLESKSPYSMHEVESFMERYNIYKPSGASYTSLCDILRAHWTKYMTDALVDLFTKQKVSDLSSTQLHTLAAERGIQSRGVSDADLGRQLIRYMVDNLLTVDALQFGLGEASVSIVDTIMNGTLDIASESITPKQRLAIMMVGARWNPRLLEFISVPDPSDAQLRLEFENFQQAMNNLRGAVIKLSDQQAIKAASQLASTIAKTASKQEKVSAEAISENTSVPTRTQARSEDDIVHFIANMKFATLPDSTFRVASQMVKSSGLLKKLAAGQFVSFVPDDDFVKNVVLRALKCTLDQFLAAPSLSQILSLNTFRDSGKFRVGSFKSLQGKEWPIRRVTNEDGTFSWVADDKNDPKHTKEIAISDDVLVHANLKFHRLDGLLLTVPLRDELMRQVKEPVKSSPARVKSSSKPAPSPVPVFNLEGLDDDAEPQQEAPRIKTEDEMIQELLAFEGVKYQSVHDLLYGKNGLLKNLQAAEPSRLKPEDLTRRKGSKYIDKSEGEVLKRIAVVFAEQRRVNPNFDVQLTGDATRTLEDLLKLKIRATPARVPPPVVDEKTLLETISQRKELTMMSKLLNEVQPAIQLSGRNLFLPTDSALKNFLTTTGVSLERLKDADTLSFFIDAHSSKDDVDGDEIEMEDGNEHDVDGMTLDGPFEALDGKLYVLHSVFRTEELAGQLGFELGEAPSETREEPSETLGDAPTGDCERLEYLAQKVGVRASTMREVFGEGPLQFPGGVESMTNEEFKDFYLAQISGALPQLDISEVSSFLTSGFVKFLRAVAIAYSSSQSAADLAFGCDELGKLHIVGTRREITGHGMSTQVEVEPTPDESAEGVEPTPEVAPEKGKEEADEGASGPQENPLLEAVKSRDDLSETLSWLELTGLADSLADGSNVTIFAPDNKAWRLLYAKLKKTKEQLIDKMLGAAGEVLKLHVVPQVLDHDDLLTIGNSPDFHVDTLQGTKVPIGYSAQSDLGVAYGTSDVELKVPSFEGALYVISAIQQVDTLTKFKRAPFPVQEPEGPPVVVADLSGVVPLKSAMEPIEEISTELEEEPIATPISLEEIPVDEDGLVKGEAPVDIEIPEVLTKLISESQEQEASPEEDSGLLMYNFTESEEDLSASHLAFTISTQFDGLDVFNFAKNRAVTLFVPNNDAWVNADFSAYTEDDDADAKVTELGDEHSEVLDRVVLRHVMDGGFSWEALKEKLEAGAESFVMMDGEGEPARLQDGQIYFRENHLDMITESRQFGNCWMHLISGVLVPLEVQVEEEDAEMAAAVAASLEDNIPVFTLEGLDEDE